MGVEHDTDPVSLAGKIATMTAALVNAVAAHRSFEDFCAELNVTADERQQLVEYLAFMRARNTIRALTR